MRCKICGLDCPPGAKICRDCASARKRAFAQTVTLPLLAAVGAPSVERPRFAPKPLRPRAANDSKVKQAKVERSVAPAEAVAALPLNVVPRKLGVAWILGGIVVVALVVLLLLRTMTNGSHFGEDVAPAVPAVVMPPPIMPQQAQLPDPSALEPPTAKVAPVKPRKAPPRVEPLPEDAVVQASVPEPAPVAHAPAPAPRVTEATRSDPWQAMNEGFARCAREALFDRIGCEQKLRLQYCGNSWGLVPQCPIGPATDHGQ
jgi:hypothetical protein